MRGKGWLLVWGRWWSLYVGLDHILSLGIHIEPRRRPHGESSTYGPYVDLHFPMACLSLGNNPVYVGSLDAQRAFARSNLPVGGIPWRS